MARGGERERQEEEEGFPTDPSESLQTNPSPLLRPNNSSMEDKASAIGNANHPSSTDVPLEIEEPLFTDESVDMLKSGGNNNSLEEIDDDHSASLTPNTYSIIFVADPRSVAFCFGIIGFLFQVSLASLALVDLHDLSSNDNFMKAPGGIPTYVRVAGYLSVVLAVPLFTDLLDSVERIHEGYSTRVLQQAPHATRCKFLLAYGCQFLSGALFQWLIFVLIVQSTTVISMLLNFAALQFITEVDDVAFSLAERGYFSLSIKDTCHVVQELKTPNTKGPWLRRIVFLLVVLAVLVGYSYVFIRQKTGSYLCNRIEVQFGDDISAVLPLFSGVYSIDKSKMENDRFVYIDEVSEWQIFRYCRSQQAWVFAIFNDESDPSKEEDDYYDEICDRNTWLSRSPSTRSFSILDVEPSKWLTKTTQVNALVYPVDYFVIRCLDCDEEKTCNSLGGTCRFDDKISDKRVCKCNEGFYGNECQFDVKRTVCDSITFDRRFDPFEAFGFIYGTRYDLVRDDNGNFMDFFNKTVYAYTYTEDDDFGNFGFMEIITYYGRRYYLTSVNWMDGGVPNATVETAARLYVEQLREYREFGFALGEVSAFVSDPLDIASAKDKLTPTDLNWYYTSADGTGFRVNAGPSVSTRLVCEQCIAAYDSNCGFGQCKFNDTADFFGTCDCQDGYVGSHCEYYNPDDVNSAAR